MPQKMLLAGSCLLLSASMGLASAQPLDLQALARQAVSAEASVAAPAIANLREAGPAGLEALLKVHDQVLKAHRQGKDGEEWTRLSRALNAVGGQYDCHASGLYWYTDLEAARKVARAEGKPILSLRLLGKLTEECSCANSRFFRSTLYANTDISRLLREQFVLHWKSVRPVPKVTIDFGDGRKLERTLTGNSIHYILDAEGRPIDAIPGLYGPKAFREQLELARETARRLRRARPQDREGLLRAYHSRRQSAILSQWSADLSKAGVTATPIPPSGSPFNQNTATRPPNAREAARVAVTKGIVETRLLAGLAGQGYPTVQVNSGDSLEKATTDEVWKKIAALHAGEATLDQGSVALISEHTPSAVQASRRTRSKDEVESPLLRMIRNFQNSIALDTVKNEYLFHRQIHQWFAAGDSVTHDVDGLNKRIYANLFLTPDSDPWLGLVDEETYTGLRNYGITSDSR